MLHSKLCSVLSEYTTKALNKNYYHRVWPQIFRIPSISTLSSTVQYSTKLHSGLGIDEEVTHQEFYYKQTQKGKEIKAIRARQQKQNIRAIAAIVLIHHRTRISQQNIYKDIQ